LASKVLNLSEKDRIELMIAALYHDVTTPPFAHATEEILKSFYGFDHERHFYDLITGQSKDLGGFYAQIFQGRALKLPKLCQSAQARRIGIDLFRIPELVFGKENDTLSSLINGDIDLDNIDNVVRAASAMGVDGADKHLAEALAKSFVFYKGEKIAILETAKSYIEKWKRLRGILYDMILCSIDDFSLQTMLKHALRYLIESDDENIQLREEDWKLTEEEILKKIGEHPDARDVYRRMQLKDLYECLNLVWIKGHGVLEYIENEKTQQNLEKLSEDVLHIRAISNYYLDKRQRDIQRLFMFFNKAYQSERRSLEEPALLVGFFTPDRVDFVDKNTEKKFIDKQRKKEFIYRLGEELPDYLSLYSVKIVTQNRYPKIRLEEKIK
jgi:HD superfamily phosphohydrolase